jgi:hypothetical protein
LYGTYGTYWLILFFGDILLLRQTSYWSNTLHDIDANLLWWWVHGRDLMFLQQCGCFDFFATGSGNSQNHLYWHTLERWFFSLFNFMPL